MSYTAGYDRDTRTDGTQGDRTRCLCAQAAFFTQIAREPHLSEEGSCSRFPSSVPGVEGGKCCQVGTWWSFPLVRQASIQNLALCHPPRLCLKLHVNRVWRALPQHPLPTGQLVCRSHPDIYNFPPVLPFLVHSFESRVLTLTLALSGEWKYHRQG